MKDPMTMSALIAWLETKDPDETYQYSFPDCCLLFQYFTAAGLKPLGVVPQGWRDRPLSDGAGYKPLPPGFDHVSSGSPETFGSALIRARIWEAAYA